MTRINNLSTDLLNLAGSRMMSDDERAMLSEAVALIRSLAALVRAVETGPVLGDVCHDVDGVNWFEARADLLDEWREEER